MARLKTTKASGSKQRSVNGVDNERHECVVELTSKQVLETLLCDYTSAQDPLWQELISFTRLKGEIVKAIRGLAVPVLPIPKGLLVIQAQQRRAAHARRMKAATLRHRREVLELRKVQAAHARSFKGAKITTLPDN
ncbi:hypothetical protein PHYPSEUDO_011392 [Phytophthora pseudosyringae]|uniref:Uncharacterized protein n=1 Tax=Phytophthora pseudosyringae TaxID=221518 RepID=A0A8T1V993_9STRA|nr:hypothetical protein PHYPSEUDO_011392 [Phytophthora pseudosyringae]